MERQFGELGEVVSLPENAADQLASSEHEIAIATESLKLFNEQRTALQEKILGIHTDESILARSADIGALSEMRQQLRNHESDISKREEEIRVLWQMVEESTRQLGWAQESEDAVLQRLPGSLVRSAINNLIRRHEALAHALLTAEESFNSREEEVKLINAEIAALPVTQTPVTLIDALAKARNLGDVTSQEQRFETQVGRLKRGLDAAEIELGSWNPGMDGLRKLLPPAQDETNALIKRRGDLELTVSNINDRIAEAKSEIQKLELEISQFKSAHHPVTLADVQRVRTSRDSIWQAIKIGEVKLNEAAIGYEKEVAESDVLSDKRHDKAQEETGLQALLDRMERLQQQLADFESRLQQNTQVLTSLDQDWDTRIKAVGLDGMLLLQVNDWRAAREHVLSAAGDLVEAQASQEDFI
ncbi:MAG: hypothetical protein ACD_23C01014G0001, partial [uncultured bacterium]